MELIALHPHLREDEDEELDPKRLKFGMSKADLDELKRRVKETKKLKNKTYKSQIH